MSDIAEDIIKSSSISAEMESNIENMKSSGRKRAADQIEGFADDDTDVNTSAQTALENKVEDIDDSPYNWVSYDDPTSGKPYYYNLITKKTQWEKPNGFQHPDIPTTHNTSYSQQQPSYSTGVEFKATFNSRTGAFSASSDSTYWETKGRPNDREGRQMSAFFDINELEENRRKAADVKNKLAKSNIDWKKYGEEKKAKKLARNREWLAND